MRKFSGVSKFPLGFWNFMSMKEFDEQDLKDWEEAAFSCIQSPYYSLDKEDMAKLEMILEWCIEKKVKVILRDPRVSIDDLRENKLGEDKKAELPTDYGSRVAEAVAQFKDRPQVIGFAILDEPHWDFYDAVVEAVRTVKRHSERLIPYVNLLPAFPEVAEIIRFNNYDRYLEQYVEQTGAKQVSYDYYGQMMEREIENPYYYINLNHYKNLSMQGIEFWNIILSTPHFRYRKPSYDDLRWQANTSLAYGAKGIWYFTLYTPDIYGNIETNYRHGPIDCWGDRTDTFYHIRDVNRELHQRWGNLFVDLQLLKVGHYPEPSEKELPVFDSGGTVKEIVIKTGHQPKLILSEFRHRHTGQKYIFVVNDNPRDSIRVQVNMDGVQRLQRFSIYGEAHNMDNQSKCTDIFQVQLWLAPGQGELMAIEAIELK